MGLTTNSARDDKKQDDKPLLRVEDVYKSFDDRAILKGVSLDLYRNETLTVLGKSGTGKSVLLKLIVGLLYPDQGNVYLKDVNVSELPEEKLASIRKNIGFLFQGAALFDSLTIGENLDLFLVKHTKLAAKDREGKIISALEMVGLKDVIDSMPSELSGGMKKRAGLARSIILEPELMLYDEPTTGLDPVTAASIAELILSLQDQLGIASIVVTHDLPTAFTVTDRAVVLSEGKKIFDGQIEDLSKQDDPFLKQYLSASEMDRTRHERLLHEAHQRYRTQSAEDQQLNTPLSL